MLAALPVAAALTRIHSQARGGRDSPDAPCRFELARGARLEAFMDRCCLWMGLAALALNPTQALAQLDASEAAAASAPGAGAGRPPPAPEAARLQASKQAAARACLGVDAGVYTAPPRAAQAPLSLLPAQPPSAAPSLRAPPSLPTPTPSPAMTRPMLPATITHCDAAGCWASDGSRLQRSGLGLLGPRGFCTQTAGVLNCP